eukprot:jgi/Undpi1/4607/HiC_scaffold_18.g07961.m1
MRPCSARFAWITTALLLGDGVSPQRFSQGIPIAGIGSVRNLREPPFPTTSYSPASVEGDKSWDRPTITEEELIEALEIDSQVTVVGHVQLGELACESLVAAQNASRLQIALSADEVVVAEQSSYTVVAGDTFTDGLRRHTWAGVVNESANAGNESFARAVSMTWATVCDVESFLLKVTTHHTNGNTSMVKSIPCAGSATTICVVELFSSRGRSEQQQLFDRPAIDVMMLYTDLALVQLGNVSAAQMESTITEGLVTTNTAFENSEVSIEFSLVYVGQDSEMSSTEVLIDLQSNDQVAALRDLYGADLVQLVGAFTDVCGLG